MIRIKYIDKLPPFMRNRYVLTLLIFFIWVALLDSNNLVARYREMKALRKLKNDREYLVKKIEEDKIKLRELETDNDNLEKFAREQYHMKKPDEDLFIVLTPREDRQIARKNNK